VLHLLAIANEAKISLSIDDFDRISSRVPIIADLKPGGRFVATISTQQAALRWSQSASLKLNWLRGDSITVTGHTLAEEAAAARKRPRSRLSASSTRRSSRQADRHPQRNLAPDGLRHKGCGHNLQNFRGPARVFESERSSFHRRRKKHHQSRRCNRHSLRRPEGGPGMREMLAVTAALVGAGLAIPSLSSRRPFFRRYPRLHGRHVAPKPLAVAR